MPARRLGRALDLKEQNRALWSVDHQYCCNGFLSVIIGSCPSAVQCSVTESTSNVGQDSKTSWRILQTSCLVALREDALQAMIHLLSRTGRDHLVRQEVFYFILNLYMCDIHK